MTQLPPNTEIIFLDRKLLPSLIFYLPQRAREVASSDMLLRQQPRDTFYVLFVEPDFNDLAEKLGRPVSVLEEIEIDRTVYVLARIEAILHGH
jgi:hypothetical protein